MDCIIHRVTKSQTQQSNFYLSNFHFVGKVMALLFNMLSRFVTVFLPRSKRLLISWLQSPSAGIWEPKKIKSLCLSGVSDARLLMEMKILGY